KRLLILDTDAHAGNGTSEYFYAEPRVLFIDLHQDPMTLYPGTGFVDEVGSGAGEGFNINIPMPPGAGDESYRLAFEEVVEPLCAEFRPELIIRNGGSDPHFSDGLTRLGVTVSGFHMIGERVRRMTGVCGGRQIDLIASGYNEKVLPYAWLALISGITGFEAAIEEPGPAPASLRNDAALEETRRVIQRLKGAAGRYWRSL
ncbi:MAG: histone deacetylase, partial [Chloroflexi bacterium]|nr:histone deacetylase [Chloroflexota bacterium]